MRNVFWAPAARWLEYRVDQPHFGLLYITSPSTIHNHVPLQRTYYQVVTSSKRLPLTLELGTIERSGAILDSFLRPIGNKGIE